ncbi:zinc finger X-chromosomal protein [Leptinotarsa decemlineata]|uniref:zinc finger X-chromosomal protein n=1 Tax=Leptinotarsa decemlineata TaxID=7539 RepID=UPI000C253E37|nr:zinc finger protein 732-like [Leptinotarsa decemlineata]XP_023015344.1 zinc finger protein 732-like [Leptinotarsa decemlineata]
MQFPPDFVCTECSHEFDSAASLLQHFARHVILYESEFENDKSSDSGIEDVNPLKFCSVTIDENQESNGEIYDNIFYPLTQINKPEPCLMKKHQCSFCHKKFGWPTDLKRHIMIHTGERPFKCNHCNSSFTRNFLLLKHQRKIHFDEIKLKIPDLKPIGTVEGSSKTYENSHFSR